PDPSGNLRTPDHHRGPTSRLTDVHQTGSTPISQMRLNSESTAASAAPMMMFMSHYRVSEAADLLGVSADTVRRTIDAGELDSARDDSGRVIVPGRALAQWA